MAWTYTANPGAVPRDKVRFLVGDVAETPQSLADGEVDYLITLYPGSPELAAAAVAESMADRYSGLSATSKSVGDLSLSTDYGSTAMRFAALARRLRTRSYGIAIDLMADTSDKVFHLGMHDFPRVNNLENSPEGLTW